MLYFMLYFHEIYNYKLLWLSLFSGVVYVVGYTNPDSVFVRGVH